MRLDYDRKNFSKNFLKSCNFRVLSRLAYEGGDEPMDNALLASKVREDQINYLMVTYGTSVMRMCYAYLKDTGMAEDAAQDTFIKAYQHLDQFDAHEAWSEKAWLMRIAINTCKDYRRSAWFRHTDCFCQEKNAAKTNEKVQRLTEPKIDIKQGSYGFAVFTVDCSMSASFKRQDLRLLKSRR